MPQAVVTGAGQGIGRGIAQRLAHDGFTVVVADRDEAAAEKVAAEVGGTAAVCDVTDPASVGALAERLDDLDVLVNNAGIYLFEPLARVTPESFRKVMDVNVLGSLLCIQALAEPLSRGEGGSVVNIASMSATLPVPGTGMYSPSKAAVRSLTELAAVEYAPLRIRVNAVAPGRITTEGSAARQSDPERERRTAELLPAGRLGYPDDIAAAVSFFARSDSRYVTGQTLLVDGGLTIGTIPYFQKAQG
ncbi:glucose 1-dehydrogenase [Pseudonocardia acidicola]|uniref:Glucose 1-dehydrogenase n=1 Tax=Pseudonocardia acidicola TaxID=2724939 RepID=A0ABX1SDH8_9PSEU|nr:glucose 1-dehydrogenase [Pseudonocardia acidicola]